MRTGRTADGFGAAGRPTYPAHWARRSQSPPKSAGLPPSLRTLGTLPIEGRTCGRTHLQRDAVRALVDHQALQVVAQTLIRSAPTQVLQQERVKPAACATSDEHSAQATRRKQCCVALVRGGERRTGSSENVQCRYPIAGQSSMAAPGGTYLRHRIGLERCLALATQSSHFATALHASEAQTFVECARSLRGLE